MDPHIANLLKISELANSIYNQWMDQYHYCPTCGAMEGPPNEAGWTVMHEQECPLAEFMRLADAILPVELLS